MILCMSEKKQTGIVPAHKTGIPIDVQSLIELGDEKQAKIFFDVVRTRLKNVNSWHTIAGGLSAKFQLVNKDGIDVERSPQKGDYFKIDIPGPGTISGEGYDWVQVEKVEGTLTSDRESFGFRVRPAQNPHDNKDIAHFFSRESTSSFTVTREKNKVIAAIYDRNTKPNKKASPIVDKVRDLIVATAGILAFSKIQWKKLTDGLLEKDK